MGGADTVLRKPAPKNDAPSEHVEQRNFIQWFRRTYPGVRIYAIPNGGFRGKTQAGKLKAEGVSRGVPDMHIPEWRAWIEMKRQKGSSVSQDQKDWHCYLKGIGDTVLVTRGCDAAIKECRRLYNHRLLERKDIGAG